MTESWLEGEDPSRVLAKVKLAEGLLQLHLNISQKNNKFQVLPMQSQSLFQHSAIWEVTRKHPKTFSMMHCLNNRADLRIKSFNNNIKRYCLKSVLLKKWELLEVTKRCPKHFSIILLIRKNRSNPFDSAPLATLHFAILWHHKWLVLHNFSQT